MRTSTRPPSAGRPVLAAVALAVLTGCSGGVQPSSAESGDGGAARDQQAAARSARSEPSPGNPPAQGTVIQPGRPGEEAETLPPDATVPAVGYNDADVEFVRMMIPHHAQALEMGKLARTRAQDSQVQAMARRIADAQGAEIIRMSAWLERKGFDAPTAADLERQRQQHGQHRMMSGMLSPAQMDRLAAADGRRFDVLFLRFMIQHHQGAVDMAERASVHGSDIMAGEMAADIAAGQNAEISRMRALLRQL